MKNLEAFLKKIGVKPDTISKLQSEEDLDVEPFANEYRGQIRSVIANDPELIDSLKSEINGTVLSKVEHKLKKTFGLDPSEIAGKKFDEIVSIAYEKSKSVAAGTSEELQNKLVELSRENKRLIEEVIPEKESAAQQAIKSFKKDSKLKSILSNKQLLVSQDVVIPALYERLNKAYEVDLGEDESFVVKTKNGLNPLNEDGTKVVSFDEILENQLKDMGVLKQSNANPNQPERKTVSLSGTQEPKFNLPGLAAAKENAEKMKSIRTFGK